MIGMVLSSPMNNIDQSYDWVENKEAVTYGYQRRICKSLKTTPVTHSTRVDATEFTFKVIEQFKLKVTQECRGNGVSQRCSESKDYITTTDDNYFHFSSL